MGRHRPVGTAENSPGFQPRVEMAETMIKAETAVRCHDHNFALFEKMPPGWQAGGWPGGEGHVIAVPLFLCAGDLCGGC